MRRECRERFPRHQFQRKPLISDPGIHHGTCVTYVPWCMSGTLSHVGGENVPGIPGACATHNFTYVVRGPCTIRQMHQHKPLLSACSFLLLGSCDWSSAMRQNLRGEYCITKLPFWNSSYTPRWFTWRCTKSLMWNGSQRAWLVWSKAKNHGHSCIL